jgi:hypothetical protein
MLDYSNYQTTSAIPEASSMIETFRAIGYNIETAVADIVDNSISAEAKIIWINFEWKGSDTWLSVKDDGHGMDNDELIQALRPGSKNPLAERSVKDLGRFGLGLKTASFSQCKQLTVLSKKTDNSAVYWTWDLNYVNQTGNWDLIKYLPNSFNEDVLENMTSGTIVIWNQLDRVVNNLKKEDENSHNKFLQIMSHVKYHLSMVFHRFISAKKISIMFQERPIEPWDPFLINEPSTQFFPVEHLQNGKVIVKGYVLPHKSKLSLHKFREAEGSKGWNEQQGFYIYRNDRLLLAGDWLGMFRKEEHYKLARIEINLPNSLDADWQIDIKKSVARPPIQLREQLKAYAGKVRARAVEIYRHKGKNLNTTNRQKFIPLWLDHKRGGKWSYKINREHPLLLNVREQVKTRPEKAIETLLKFIEETIPVKSIFIRESEEPEDHGKPFEGTNHEDVMVLMKSIYSSLTDQGIIKAEALAIIANLEPFNHYPEYITSLNDHD